MSPDAEKYVQFKITSMFDYIRTITGKNRIEISIRNSGMRMYMCPLSQATPALRTKRLPASAYKETVCFKT